MPIREPSLDEFEVQENEVIHKPTNARFTAYPGIPHLHSFNRSRLGDILPNGDDYEIGAVQRIAEQLLARRPSLRQTWTCAICGQSIIHGPQGIIEIPDDYYEVCKLRENMIGDECIAFADMPQALRLMADKK
jgi:hypothetical protein